MGEVGDDMIIPIGKRWYDLMPLVKSSFKTSSKFDESKLRQEADQLINGDRKKFLAYKQAKNKADFNWINSVLTSGSFTDRLSAFTLLIQESPIHNIYSIQKLLDIINPKVVRECLMTMDNLKDLLLSDLLPKRQLRKFSDLIQFLPVKDGVKRNQILMLIHFEDKIRAIYQEFQERLEKLSLDGPDALKSKAIHVMFDLLSSRFEHDKSLLEKLVNKFGDPAPKRASHVGYLLSKLVNQKKDSKLKVTVCKEVERVLFRPHINEKAQYYSLRFMSEVALSKSDSKLANHIIETYFKFFDASAKKSNLNNKMMNVLLTGLSRAFPYSNLEPKTLEERLESFYKLLHMVDKGTAVQGLSLIFNVLNIKDSGMIADRFYSVLYRSLHEINLDNCAKKGLYLSLLFKALKQDPVPVRIKAFIKRLLQQTLHYSPPVTCAILALISEITKDRPDILRIRSTTVDEKITREPNSDDEEGDEFYEDVPISDDEKSAVKTNDSEKVDSAWIHQKNNKSNQVRDGRYDPFGRNPLFSNADCCDIWELNLLPSHFHPSAALFADKVANCHLIVYDGDPLLDFTSNNFLDRFVFRNPKKVEKEKASKSYKSTLFARASKSKDRIIPIQQLTQKSKSKIPLEERFIYDYLVQKKKEEKEKEDDNASVDSEDFDRILEKFEPDADDSFAEGLKRDRMKGRTSQDSDGDDGYPSSEDELGDDEDIDIDTDDEEYKAAFGDIDEEIADAKREAAMFEDDDDNDGDDDDGEDLSRFKRRGRDKSLTKLFAAADKFSHLLEGRESGDENNEEDDDDESGDDNRKGKKKRHKNFKKSRPNSRKSFKRDRNPKRRRR